MAITRRKFGGMLVAGVSALFTADWCAAKKTRSGRYVRALKVRMFPGKIVPLDEDEVSMKGKWLG